MKGINSPTRSIKSILSKKGWIDIPASGTSMYPLIKEGDICKFTSIENLGNLSKGDVILYVSDQGQLVGHRYVRRYEEDGAFHYLFKGDTNYTLDPPVHEDQLIGKLARIKKRHYSLDPNGALAKWWGAVVFNFPAVPRYCKRYFNLRSKIKPLTRVRRHA